MRMRTFLLIPILILFAAGLAAQPARVEPVRGPFWSGTVRGQGRTEIIADKGIVVTAGADTKACFCYDTDLMRLSLAWTGDFLEFGNTLTRIEWPPRSEEHTSELQSQSNLVCRLLLEKKKCQITHNLHHSSIQMSRFLQPMMRACSPYHPIPRSPVDLVS